VGAREIGYLYGQFKRLNNRHTGAITGKGFDYGGSRMRPEATGYGCVYMMREALSHAGDDLEGKKCLVSGSGNVAQFCTEKLIQLGAKVLTLSDSGGTIYDPDGIDETKLAWIQELKNIRRGRISEYVKEFPRAEYLEGKRPWEVPADLAFPCATQNEILYTDAESLVKNGVRAVCEGANMPSVKEAIDCFQEAGLIFVPGKAANAGGVAVSGLEMTQNSMRIHWTAEEVDAKLLSIIQSIHGRCVEFGTHNQGIDYVRGANIGAFTKIADTLLAYGVV
jgi:glutamate dehydrogenase (NADP+)